MQLSPRYGPDALIRIVGFAPSAIAAPAIRQRRRLAGALASFTDAQWNHPSRCEGWSARDVIVHLDTTNTFWVHSIEAGLRGEPTEYLASFDPVASPAALVAAAGDISASEVLDRFTASTEELVGILSAMTDDQWALPAEAPPGHISIDALAHHALWDAWVHERDVMLPLGETPPEESDEVAACLRYAAALSPAYAISQGASGSGVIAIDATDPETRLVVEVGAHVEVRPGTAADADARLEGGAAALAEALSVRGPLDAAAVPADAAWLVEGLAAAFDQ